MNMDDHNMNVFGNNEMIITEFYQVHPDDVKSFDNSLNELIDAGIGKIITVEIEENDTQGRRVLLLTNDENQSYYLELSEHGSIIQLRKDGLEGDVILCPDTCGGIV